MAEFPKEQYEVVLDDLRNIRRFVEERKRLNEPFGGIYQDIETQMWNIFEDDKEAFRLETWPARFLVDMVVQAVTELNDEKFEEFLSWFGEWIHNEFRTGRSPAQLMAIREQESHRSLGQPE